MTTDPSIVRIIQHYHPDWNPPTDNGREWLKTCCPFHGDETASAAVSYEHNAFGCLACSVKGSEVSLVKSVEGVSYREAVARSAEILGGCGSPVSPKPARVARRSVFTEPGVRSPGDREVPAGVCRGTFGGA